MKKFYAILCLAIASLTQLQAQAPQGFNYQATVRNSSGDLIVNTNVYFKFNVIQGSQTAVPIFTETHYVPTDDLGQVNLVIGQGTANTGTFSELDWSLGSYYLGIELDTGNGYAAMGTTQLLSVPYALYAENSGNSTLTTPNLETVLAENNSAGQQQIKNLLDPTDGADAVTKSYVDALSNTQGLMNFNGWDNYQVWTDGTSVQLTPNSFVFVNANDTTLVFPDGPDNCCFGDVIYIYVMDGDPLTPLSFTLQANGFPVAVGGGDMPLEFTSTDAIGGEFWSVGLKTIVNVGDYWMVADFQGQIITDSDIDNDGDGFTENQGDCDDNNATIYPPVIPNQEITICSGDTFVFDPVNNPPTTLVPEGTTYTWTVTDPYGEIDGESSTTSSQSQISQTLNNYFGAFYGISYEVTPYSPSGCQGQTFELIVYVTLPTVINSIDDMVLMDGEYRAIDISSYPTDNNATVTYDWVSDIDFGAGLSGEGNTLDFLATNSSSNPITANVTVSATVTYNGTSCLVPSETFTVTVCAEEIEDGIDNDCDGEIDEGFNESSNSNIDMTNGTFTQCEGVLYDSGGELNNYSGNEDYTLTICPDGSGTSTVLEFISFVTQASVDVLTIFNGTTTSDPILGTYSGTQTLGTITADNTSGCLTLRFVSNGGVNTAGFAANISCEFAGIVSCDGAPYPSIVYGSQEWTVENACHITYRDGTEIPQVTDNTEWESLTTGAWSYYNNDPTKHRLYNWYAVAGIHDTDPNTPNKAFAPAGWHVPSDAEWTTLENYLIANGYNYDGTTSGDKIAKAMASTTGWNSSTNTGAPGNNQSTNNSSGFNAFPEGSRSGYYGGFIFEGDSVSFWCSNEPSSSNAWDRVLSSYSGTLNRHSFDLYSKQNGFSVRFVRD